VTDDTLTIKVCHNEPESLLNSPTCRPSRLLDHTRRRNPQRALRDVCRRASAESVRREHFLARYSTAACQKQAVHEPLSWRKAVKALSRASRMMW
jgi:hypothetical protein